MKTASVVLAKTAGVTAKAAEIVIAGAAHAREAAEAASSLRFAVETYDRTDLPGGIRVLSAPQAGARSVSVGCWLGVGSRDEAPADAGIAHLIEHLLFKGTPSRTALAIAESFDAIGGDLNAFTTKEATCVHARVLPADLELTIDTIADLVQHPSLGTADIEVERGVVLEEISMHEDTPDDLVFDVFAEALWPDQAVGRRIQGFAETLRAASLDQIRGFHQTRYPTVPMVVSASGVIDHDTFVALVRDRFASGARPVEPRHDAPPRAQTGVRAVATRDVEQCHLVLGVQGMSRIDPRRYAFAVLNAALGGGMSSRLFQEIREVRGLAYNVVSGNQGLAGAGLFTVYAGTAPEQVGEVARLCADLIGEVAAHGITEVEVERAKGHLVGGLVLGFEEPGAMMNHLGKAGLLHDEILTPGQVVELVKSVTREDCAAVAHDVFNAEAWSVAVVGPDPDPQVTAFQLEGAAA